MVVKYDFLVEASPKKQHKKEKKFVTFYK